MADDAGLGVTVDVGLPLPGRGVWVASADVFRLQALELLLRAELVGLGFRNDVSEGNGGWAGSAGGTYHFCELSGTSLLRSNASRQALGSFGS